MPETRPVAPAGHESQQKSTSDRKRFHNPSFPTAVLAADGNVLHLSPAAKRLLGYSQSEPVEVSFFSLIHRNQLFQVMRDVADMVCHGKSSATWLLRLRSVQGRWQWFKADAHYRPDEPHAPLTVILRSM